ncbi:putative membrane-anchored protein [Micromonospora luteifusca]|uniref:Membrane-anchored protein n=1 Tax=Micromonospora luteifusca TaxID=709860 RepID=A0ABS2M3F0_9ACTN|nr:DoxX family protein [Micromonospora luteifusca]MBM7494960.1 putative membrane-anchored protein [Micromonospora luteifusca]
MNLTLWIAAGLLALVALGGGVSKTFVRKQKLEKRVASGWVKDVSPGFVRTLGVLELLAAVGLVLPAVVGIAPVLVPVTGVCMALLMVGAVITHVRYHDGAKIVVVVSVYLALAAFIAWGRFGPEAFTG